HASLLLHTRTGPVDDALKGYIEERLQTFALSATALGRFLSDPQEFLLVDILMQPEHFDESSVRSLGYGSAVHWALRQWGVAKTEGKEFGTGQFIEAFDWYLQERTILTKKQREDLLALGKIALPNYFSGRLRTSPAFLYAVEREYRARLSDSNIPSGIPLKGKIDRIDLPSATSALATVIDYKAGKPKSESEIRGGMEEGAVSRGKDGSHFRQLTFYALLLEHADPLLKPQSFVLDYIGERGEEPLQRAFVVSDPEKDSLRNLIGEVWQKILNLDFTPIE
ncbi:PD-(D/E)XK nuclease family protein, partial [Candidatus Peregrinibacteria bacterium]|nr:PD-(D/E)XK nuclease family protein [Candidatus Peregrinibacteria bacterium]